jgi:phosphoribosylglycinamide formyltransferase 1
VSAFCNLVVDLDAGFAIESRPDIEIGTSEPADDRTLAWIDDVFGGGWSSEANAGANLVARRAGAPVGFATIDPRGLTFAWLDGLARERDVGIFGPFGVAPEERASGLGVLLLRLALDALRERGYRRALVAAVTDERLVRFYGDAVGARVAERFERASLYRPARRALVMASGNGSNFQAVLDAVRNGTLPIEIGGLLANDPRAYAIQRARNANIEIEVVAWDRATETRAQYDARLLDAAHASEPDLILLLGWMHLLSDAFVSAFPNLLNLHPAFLPLDPTRDDVALPDGTLIAAFRGPRAVRDALAASSAWVGATLHRVTNATDRGAVMARKPLRVEPEEDEAHLMERMHELERGVVRAGVMRWLYER